MIENSLVVLGGSVCTEYGLQVTKSLVGNLAKQGINIVSGLETKISILALETSIFVGGRSIAYLGYGIDKVKRNKSISRVIKRLLESPRGKIYAPFNKSTKASRSSYINRDRLMIKESEGVLVIESVYGSRIFSAVEYALSLNKPIFSVPGSVFSYTSRGTNFLIKTGAVLVEDHSDVLGFYKIDK